MTVSVAHAAQGVSVGTSKTTSTTVNSTMMVIAKGRPTSPSKGNTIANTNGVDINVGNGTGNSGGGNSSGSDTDGFASSATALRRLYFKSGRSVKSKLSSACGGGGENTVATSIKSYGVTVAMGALSSASSSAVAAGVPKVSKFLLCNLLFGNLIYLYVLSLKVIIMGSSSASITETNINTSTDSASTLITNVTATDTSEAYDSLDLGKTNMLRCGEANQIKQVCILFISQTFSN